MSVILEGMELPVCCRGCVMYDTMSCRILRRDVYRHAAITKDRPEDCPLRPMQEWIGLVLSKYDENKEKPWIRDPVAYTLYEVWKIMDSKVSYGPSERGDGDGKG